MVENKNKNIQSFNCGFGGLSPPKLENFFNNFIKNLNYKIVKFKKISRIFRKFSLYLFKTRNFLIYSGRSPRKLENISNFLEKLVKFFTNFKKNLICNGILPQPHKEPNLLTQTLHLTFSRHYG